MGFNVSKVWKSPVNVVKNKPKVKPQREEVCVDVTDKVSLGNAKSLLPEGKVCKSGKAFLKGTADLSETSNVALATDLAGKIATWTAKTFNKNSNVYDKAIDALYNKTHIGGSSLHHIVDGQHTLWGAFKAAHNALPNDTLGEEIKGTLEHLARDTCSKSGINPFFSMDIETYKSISSYLKDTFGISKRWFADMLTFNAPEVLGAAVGSIPLVLGWNKLGVQKFSEMASSFTISAVASANPLLGGLALVSALRGISKMKKESSPIKKGIKGALSGAILSGVGLAVASSISGPLLLSVGAGIAAGLSARYIFNKGWDKIASIFKGKHESEKPDTQKV